MAKQLSLRNFKAPTKAKAPVEFKSQWPELQEAIDAIHHHKPTSRAFQRLRTVADELCDKQGDKLYATLKATVERHVELRRTHLLHCMSSSNTSDFLIATATQWQDYLNYSMLVRSIFIRLDRRSAVDNRGTEHLWQLCLRLFRQILFRDTTLQSHLVECFLQAIHDERSSLFSPSAMSDIKRMLVALEIFDTVLREPILQATESFYAAESTKLTTQHKLPEYVRQVDVLLAAENSRCNRYLTEDIRAPLIKIVKTALVTQQLPFLLGPELRALFASSDTQSLAALHSLLLSNDSVHKLKDAVETYMKEEGTKIVMDTARDGDMVERLMSFKARVDMMIQGALNDKAGIFRNSIKSAFSTFINKRSNKPAELIAGYLDSFLRKGLKGKREDEVERTFQRVLDLFRFVQGKDMFEAFYQDSLSRRLLHQKTASTEYEKLLVSKLKLECGANFTSHLEGMLKDIDISAQLNADFKTHLEVTRQQPSMELYVNVLTTSNWPTYPKVNVTLPPDVVRMQELFSQFYCNKHKNRKLQWQPSQGQCILGASFQRGNKELIVSLFQAIVLLLFNDSQKLTCKEIQQATGIDMPTLKRTLQSLACGKIRVLAKSPKGKEVDETDKFIVNYKFSNERRRVKINQIQMKQTQAETDATSEKVFQDRVFAIDAAIVRVMKARKTLKHNFLLTELFQQLKFPCKPVDIKKRVETLIERDYLERDPNDPQTYKYLA